MNDFLEIGYWRQRDPRVEHVLALAEKLLAASPNEATKLESQLAAALGELRKFDTTSCPWHRGLAVAG